MLQSEMRCHYCDRVGNLKLGPDGENWHLDHKDPLARNGPDTKGNLVLACQNCNLHKSTTPYSEFYAYARARATFAKMTEPEALSTEELEELEHSWRQTFGANHVPGKAGWRVSLNGLYIELWNGNDQLSVHIFKDPSNLGFAQDDDAAFAVLAHRYVGRLIEEVRTYRKILGGN